MIVARVMMVMVLKIMMIKKRHHDCSKGATSDILTDYHSEEPDPPERKKNDFKKQTREY